jgi:hypothetical protein
VNILVLGAGGNAGINFIKCLKKAQYPITVHGADMNKYYRLAGNADHWAKLDYSSDSAKLHSIHEYVERHEIKMIHAQPDTEVRFLLENKAEFPHLTFNHSLGAFNEFSNKLYCQTKWGPLFKDYQVCSLETAMSDPDKFTGLVDCSNGHSVWFRAITGAGSRCALPVDTLEQAINWADYWVQKKGMRYSDFMLCEYLPGPEYAVQTFWVEGNLIQSQARERLVPFFGAIMPSGQTSTPAVAKTVNLRNVYDAAYKAITAIQPIPHGIYCVDLKTDSTGMVVPTEVNYGRFFTTSDFFARLDVNTPLAYVYNHQYHTRIKRIETITDEWFWIRGLDKEPVLINNSNTL